MRFQSLPLLLLPMLLLPSACNAPPQARGKPPNLLAGGRQAAQWEYAYDPARLADTCKVYTHLFTPGGRLLTKGTGGEHPHHRGLFFGFNRIRWHDQRIDNWHCTNGASQRLVAFVPPAQAALADDWQVAEIAWHIGEVRFARELRGLRARATTDGHQIDVAIELTALEHDVVLGGDPQHSGCQFRALQLFAERGQPKLEFVRPAGAVSAGEDIWQDCDWVAALLPFADGTRTVLHLDHPGNPRPCRYSTRAYGRFGSTFSGTVPVGQPLRLRYRLVVADHVIAAGRCAELAAEFAADTGG